MRGISLRALAQVKSAVHPPSDTKQETVTSGSAGGRAEKDLPSTPRCAADPTGWLMRHRQGSTDVPVGEFS